MGIPLLHPWANRLAATRFEVAGREVLDAASPPPRDANGLPIHGVLAAAPGWSVEAHKGTIEGAPFVLAGGGRRIELRLGAGYGYAQVHAPADDDVIVYEPMTAPTNALVTGGADLPLVEPGGRYEATFTITVAEGHPVGRPFAGA